MDTFWFRFANPQTPLAAGTGAAFASVTDFAAHADAVPLTSIRPEPGSAWDHVEEAQPLLVMEWPLVSLANWQEP